MSRKLLITAGVILGLSLLQELCLGPTPVGSFIANSLQILSALLAAYMCFRASQRGRGFTRPFWLLNALGFLAFAMADAGWVYYESFRHASPPGSSIFPFLSDTRSLFVAMALLADQRDEESTQLDPVALLDFIQMAIIFSLIYLGWYYIPAQHQNPHVAFLRSAEVEIGEDLAVLGLAWLQAHRARTPRMRSLYLGFTSYFVLLTAGAIITNYVHLMHGVATPTGTWLDLWWTVAHLVAVWWAAHWYLESDFFPKTRREKSFSSMLIDSSIFAAAPLIVLLQTAEVGPTWRHVSFSLLGLSIVCFAARLALSEFREARTARAAHKADQDRLEAESKFRVAFQANPESIAITTLENDTYLEVNDAFLGLTGYERSELMGKSTRELNLCADPAQHEELVGRLRRDERINQMEITLRAKSGEERSVLLSAHSVQVQGQACALSIMRDVTGQRLLERQLYQAQKMEAVGRLAGGVAHDFNNILMVASGSAQLLELWRNDSERVERYAYQIQDATRRGASLTRQLLAFSRQQVLSPAVLDLNTVITDLWKMLPRLLGEDVEAVLSLDSGLGRVNVDRGQLEQVIMNLAVNARDAMPQGGKLIVETTNVLIDGSMVGTHGVDVPPGGYILLAVSDTGIGMSPAVQAQIFEPFFTTKELGKGTGLGLATVYGIVKQSGGHIWVYSEVSKGSTFKVYLPRVEANAPETRATVEVEPAPSGSGTILLVEDEAALREVASEYLRAKGYQVLEAETGQAAVELCKSHGGSIDLLITDVVMPGISGTSVVDAVSELRPGLPAILMSGFTDRTIGPDLLGPRTIFMQKPFSLDALARKIYAILKDPN